MRFDAPWDRLLRIMTPAAIALLAVVVFLPPYLAWVFGVKAATLPLIALGCWWMAPTGFRLDGSTLYVERRAGDVSIPLQGLKRVRPIGQDELSNTFRAFGVGGFFGYYGKFYKRSVGMHAWYVTDRSKAVLLETAAGKYIVSPGDREAFVRAVTSVTR